MTQKKDENENGEGGWIDANKGRKTKKNPAAKEQVQANSERGPKAVKSSTMHGSKPPMNRSGPKQQTNERDETKQPINRPNRQHTERSQMPNEGDGKKMVEEVFRLEDEQFNVDLKQLRKEYTRTQPYRNVQPVNKKVEKQPEQIIQHVPSMLTEVHPIVTSSAKMSYAEASKKSLCTSIPIVSQIVPSENVGWGESSPVIADANDVGLDGEVVPSSSATRESTPSLTGPSISPGVNVESSIQNGAEMESSPVPATVEIIYASPQPKSDVPEKKMSQALENGGSKQAVEQVSVEKGSFATAVDQYVPAKKIEVIQSQPQVQPQVQPHVDARGVAGYPVVQQQQGGGVQAQFPYMVQPGQMSQQWAAVPQGVHMSPYVFPQQMVPSHPQMYNPGSYFPAQFIGPQSAWNTGYPGIPSDAPPGYPKQPYQQNFSRGGYQNYQNAPPHVRLAPPSSFGHHQYAASGQTQLSYGSSLPPHFGQAFQVGGESQPQPPHVVSSTGQTEGTWAPPQEAQSAWPMPSWNQNRS